MYYLENIEKRYGSGTVLRNVNCQIPTDGIVVVMGPSGAGKSTLVRLLSFIEVPDHGRIRLTLSNQEFDSPGSVKPWPRVTCVFQKQFLWPHLTLRENILLPIINKVTDAERKLGDVIGLFDMREFIDRYPNEVSGGEAQRAALARAMVLDARVILIDEPHVGLDLEQQQVLNEHLLALKKSGVSFIVVTHSLDFARHYADSVLVIEDGGISEAGTKDLLNQPRSGYLGRAVGLSQPTIHRRQE